MGLLYKFGHRTRLLDVLRSLAKTADVDMQVRTPFLRMGSSFQTCRLLGGRSLGVPPFREMITSLLLCHAIVQDFLDKLPSPVDTDAGPFRYTQYVKPSNFVPPVCPSLISPPVCKDSRLFSLSPPLSPSPPTAH